MDTSQNDQCSTSPLINKDCLGDEYYNSGECDNDILFVDGWEKSNDYIATGKCCFFAIPHQPFQATCLYLFVNKHYMLFVNVSMTMEWHEKE